MKDRDRARYIAPEARVKSGRWIRTKHRAPNPPERTTLNSCHSNMLHRRLRVTPGRQLSNNTIAKSSLTRIPSLFGRTIHCQRGSSGQLPHVCMKIPHLDLSKNAARETNETPWLFKEKRRSSVTRNFASRHRLQNSVRRNFLFDLKTYAHSNTEFVY